ncbi:nitrogen metabolite repression nmrA [Fusarium globosum]|uniref:Nitrogen metabolite repression nmrA n=1 Tax=Fusarium globosum TaxID=78864 RepID=A0A8H6D359_9HYPO|nr:nitrogen metabolite repression nmrA [Fusarium globosum]
MMSVYLVTQATGQQSQWVINHLLEAGHQIHAVVRNIEKIPAMLSDQNITLFQGESKNFDDIHKAAQGCQGAFLNTVSFPGLEVLQAKTIVEACEKAGVKNLIAATSICAYNNFPRLPSDGEIDDLLTGGAKFPYSDAHDVGIYAAAALQDPVKFRGQEIDLGNELFDFEQIRDILVKVSCREVRVVKRTPEDVEKLGIAVHGHMFQHFANMKPFGFIEGGAEEVQKKFGIPFTPLEDALQRDRVRLMECIPAKEEV